RLGHMAGIGWCVAVWRLHRRRRPIRALLYRHHHQPLADDCAASLYADAGRLPAWHAGVSPRRHAVPAAGDPLLLLLGLLGVPGQGARRCGLSLSSSSLLKKVFEVSLWATLIQDPSARRTKDSQPSAFGFEYCASHVRFRVFQQTARRYLAAGPKTTRPR